MVQWLFETKIFIPRSHCGIGWSTTLKFFDQVSNILICASYFTIAGLLLFLFYCKRKEFPHPSVLIFFALFIFFCGITHLNDYWVFWWPAYRYIVLIDSTTAFLSLITTFLLIYLLRFLLQLPSFNRLEELIEISQGDIAKIRLSELAYKDRCNQLAEQVRDLEHSTKTGTWVKESSDKIDRLKKIVESFKGDFLS